MECCLLGSEQLCNKKSIIQNGMILQSSIAFTLNEPIDLKLFETIISIFINFRKLIPMLPFIAPFASEMRSMFFPISNIEYIHCYSKFEINNEQISIKKYKNSTLKPLAADDNFLWNIQHFFIIIIISY